MKNYGTRVMLMAGLFYSGAANIKGGYPREISLLHARVDGNPVFLHAREREGAATPSHMQERD